METRTASAPLRLKLLGGFGLYVGAQERAIPTKKNRALLAILALSPAQQATRERLCGLLWGDRGEEQARSSLRQSLAVLRKELGETLASALVTADDRVGLDPTEVVSDVAEFLHHSESGRQADAARLYGGEFLADVSLREETFNDWLMAERRTIAERAIQVFETLAVSGEEASRVAFGQRLLALDPMRETSHRVLMEAYAATGDRAQALRQFDVCREILRKELGVEPSEQTTALRGKIAGSPAMWAAKSPEPPLVPLVREGKPTVAVLPFANLNADPQQQHLADGISEDIMTGMGRFRQLSVAARNASFRFKGDVDIAKAANELGAAYIVQGSLRRAGSNLRITVQLIEAATAKHLWAEAYDVAGAEVFTAQDAAVQKIVTTLIGRITESGAYHAKLKPPGSLAAYELLLRANALSWDRREDRDEARQMLEAALRIDANYATAHSLLAALTLREAVYSGHLTRTLLDVVLAHARKAVEIESNDSACQSILGWIHLARGEFELAESHIAEAQRLNPNNPYGHINRASLLILSGRPDEALPWLDEVKAADPYFQPNWVMEKIALAHFTARRYAKARDALKRTPKKRYHMLALEAACEALLDNPQRALAAMTHSKTLRPDVSVQLVSSVLPFQHDADREHLAASLIAAGFSRSSPEPRAAAESRSVPVVAVLPFQFHGIEDGGRYLADAIAEDITTDLSRYRGLTVIANTSTAHFLGSGEAPQSIGGKLGASHLVIGSLRIVGESWRIGVQVIASETGQGVWAERYEISRAELAATLDSISLAVAASIEKRIAASTAEATLRKPIDNWTAYDHYLKGRDLCMRYLDGEAIPYLNRAIELDPELAPAFAWRAIATVGLFYQDYDPARLLIAEESAKQAIVLDDKDVRGHHALGLTRLWQKQHALAGHHYDTGLALNSGDILLGYDKANWLTYTGKPQQALDMLTDLRRRDPYHPAFVHELVGFALFQLGRYADCIAEFDKLTTSHFWQHGWLASAYAKLGRLDEARRHAENVLRLKPEFSIAWVRPTFGFERPEMCSDAIEGLRLAGIPEEAGGAVLSSGARRSGAPGVSSYAGNSLSVVVAVLPFHLTGVDEQNRYLADSIVEDITTELARHGGLVVIASTSSTRFQDSGEVPAAFGARLGASHVVTGSLRVAGENWRIAVEVVEASSGRRVWSERYDLPREQFEAALDSACAAIAAVVENRIAASGAETTARKPIGNWTAYDHYLKGRALCLRYVESEAVPHLDRAVSLDPELAPAFAWRAIAYVGKFYQDYDTSWLSVAEDSAKRSIALDSGDPRGHHALGLTRLWQRRHGLAGEHYDMGLALNPADILLGYEKANWLTYTGKPQAAWEMLVRLRQRDPFPPAFAHELAGRTLFQLGRYEECIASFDKLTTSHFWQHGWLAAANARLGRLDEAKVEAQRMLKLKPGTNLAWFKNVFGFENLDLCRDAIEALQLAGISE